MNSEHRRLETLEDYAILDSKREQSYDDIAELAAAICQTPIALISLVDRERQWFKSRVGLEVSETPRVGSFCTHAIKCAEVLIVEDACLDARFASSPLVTGEPRIRFYAGAPLIAPNGEALGTVCVIDRVPRQLSEQQAQSLRVLARQTMALLELRQKSAELRQSEKLLGQAHDQAPIGIAFVSPDGKWLRVNQALCEIIGYTPQELLATTFQAITHPHDLESDLRYVGEMLAGTRRTYRMEKRYLHKEGHIVWIQLSVSLVRDEVGRPLFFISQIQDLSEQRRANEATLAALNEKETLLREIHHRVKNNLEVVASILDLQAADLPEAALATPFENCRGRIRTLALVHEQLMGAEQLSTIDFGTYLRELGLAIQSLYDPAQRIHFIVEAEPVALRIDLATPLCLIANELMTNAFKHAFPEGRRGTLRVSVRRASRGAIELQCSDDGVGLGSSAEECSSAGSLGLRMLRLLARQVRAEYSLRSSEGTRATLLVPIEA